MVIDSQEDNRKADRGEQSLVPLAHFPIDVHEYLTFYIIITVGLGLAPG